MALLEPVHQVEDLGADGDVERRDRLVGHDQPRAEGQRPGEADPLALAAGKLVRVAFHRARAEPDLLQKLDDPLPALLLVAEAVDDQRLGQDVADPHARVER